MELASEESILDEPALAAHRSLLSQVQTRSTSWRGFSEAELDLIFPHLSIIEVCHKSHLPHVEAKRSCTGHVWSHGMCTRGMCTRGMCPHCRCTRTRGMCVHRVCAHRMLAWRTVCVHASAFE